MHLFIQIIHGNQFWKVIFASFYNPTYIVHDTKSRNQNKHLTNIERHPNKYSHAHDENEMRLNHCCAFFSLVILVVVVTAAAAVVIGQRKRERELEFRNDAYYSNGVLFHCVPAAFAPNDWIIVRVVHVICGGFPFFQNIHSIFVVGVYLMVGAIAVFATEFPPTAACCCYCCRSTHYHIKYRVCWCLCRWWWWFTVYLQISMKNIHPVLV